MDISVILPVFNEKENLAPLLQEIEDSLRPLKKSFEVIAVDDFSTDGSRELLRELTGRFPGLKPVFFRRNYGQAAAIDAGFRTARGDVIVTLDSDLQNDPADIPRMTAMLESGWDVVSGWRKNRRDGALRRIPSRVANRIIRLVTGTAVHDLGCTLRVYRKEITTEIRLYGEMHRFIVPIAENLGARVCEVEVHHRPRIRGESKYGIGRTLKVLLDLVTIWFLAKYQTKPLYLFGRLCLYLYALAAAVFLFVLWEKFGQGVWVHRNPLFLIGIVMFLGGTQFLGMGILAELLVRTYFESQEKVSYAILPDGSSGA